MQIPGVIRIPFESGRHVDALPRNRQLVVYATGRDDARIAALARFLVTRGFSAAYLCGGFAAWVAAGLPVTSE